MQLPTWVKRLLWNNNVGHPRRQVRNRRDTPLDLYIMRLEERRVLNASVVLAPLVSDADSAGTVPEAVAQETSIIHDGDFHDSDASHGGDATITSDVAFEFTTVDAAEPFTASATIAERVPDVMVIDSDIPDLGNPADDYETAVIEVEDGPLSSVEFEADDIGAPVEMGPDVDLNVQAPSEVVFIDWRVSDYETLIDGVSDNAEVVILNADTDGVEQIADHLDGREDIAAIHILSHGDSGVLYLGSTRLTNENLDNYTDELNDIGASLTEDGDILIYGCDVAEGDHGSQFVERLAEATHADVAASTDDTGAADQGGDWDLEAEFGSLETQVAISMSTQASYAYMMDPPTVVYVDDDFIGTTSGADPDGPGPATNFGVDAFATIQDGITYVASGGTINVQDGSYSEDLLIDKSVTLLGAGATPLAMLTGHHTITSSDVALDNLTLTNVSDYTITIDASSAAIDNVSVTNSVFNLVGFAGVHIGGDAGSSNLISDVTLADNTFNGPANKLSNPFKIGGFFGSPASQPVDGVDFLRNEVNRGSIPINVDDAAINDILIHQNTFRDTDGVVYAWGADSPTGTLSNFVFTENDVELSNTYGVGLGANGVLGDANYGSGNRVYNNSFDCLPGGYGFRAVSVLGTVSSYVLDASGNWYGSNTPAGVAAEVSGNVDYSPWLDVGTDTDAGTPGFHGDFSALHVDDDSPQVGATGRVQEGISLVDSGGTVNVHDGTYTEDVVVNKAITLKGEATINGTLTVSAAGATISPGFSPGVITSGSVSFGATSSLAIELDGNSPGSGADNPSTGDGHDQLNVTGTVDLGGATLNLDLTDLISVQPGDVFIIVNNDDIDAITGTFGELFINGTQVTTGDPADGLDEGDIVSSDFLGDASNYTARITYTGGDGNDVALVIDGPFVLTLDGIIVVDRVDGTDNIRILNAANNATNLAAALDGTFTGFTVVDTRPISSFNADGMQLTGGADDDVLVIDLDGFNDASGTNFTGTISFDGQDETSGDVLYLNDPNLGTASETVYDTIVHVFDDPSDNGSTLFMGPDSGTIAIDQDGVGITFTSFTVAYDAIEPITQNVNTANVTLDYSVDADVVTLVDSGTQLEASAATAETLTFTAPTTTLTINLGDGDDIVNIGAAIGADTDLTNLTAALKVDGQGDIDTININDDLTLGDATVGNTGSLTVLGDTINVAGSVAIDTQMATVNAATGGVGDVTLTADTKISMNASSSITTTGGEISLLANAGATATGNFIGIDLNAADITSTSGAISLTGTGGNTGSNNHGVRLRVGSEVSSTGSGVAVGGIKIDGTGGTGSSDNIGVVLELSNAKVSSVEGNILIMGQGGAGSDIGNIGVLLSGSTVESTGTSANAATITINGTGGAGTTNDTGVEFQSSSTVTSIDGAIDITGIGAGTSVAGVLIASGTINATDGSDTATATISIKGDGAGSGAGIVLQSTVNSDQGTVTLTSEDDVKFSGTGLIDSNSGTVTVTADNAAGNNGGAFEMTDGSKIDAGSGLIDVNADGNIGVAALVTSGEVQVTTTSGAIVDAGDTHADITAAMVSLEADDGIGDAGDTNGGLESATDGGAATLTVAAITERGDIQVTNAGSLTIGTVNSVVGVTIVDGDDDNTGDNIRLTVSSPLEVNDRIVNLDGGQIDLIALGDTVSVNAIVATLDGGGDIDVDADRINLNAAAGNVTVDGNTITGLGTLQTDGGQIDLTNTASVVVTSSATLDTDHNDNGAGGNVLFYSGGDIDAAVTDLSLTIDARGQTNGGNVELVSTVGNAGLGGEFLGEFIAKTNGTGQIIVSENITVSTTINIVGTTTITTDVILKTGGAGVGGAGTSIDVNDVTGNTAGTGLDLTLDAGAGTVAMGTIGTDAAADRIGDLTVTGTTITLNGDIFTGDPDTTTNSDGGDVQLLGSTVMNGVDVTIDSTDDGGNDDGSVTVGATAGNTHTDASPNTETIIAGDEDVDIIGTFTAGGLDIQTTGDVTIDEVNTDTTDGILVGATGGPANSISLGGNLDSTNGDAASDAGAINLNSDDIVLEATVTIDADDDVGADGLITIGSTAAANVTPTTEGVEGLNLRVGNLAGDDLIVRGNLGVDSSSQRLGAIDVDAVAGATLVINGDIETRGNVDFSGAGDATLNVTGNDSSIFIIDTNDLTTVNAGYINLSGTLIDSTGIDLRFRAEGAGSALDGDVTLPDSINSAVALLARGRVITLGTVVTTGGNIDIAADFSDDNSGLDAIIFTGLGLDSTDGGTTAAGAITLTSGGGNNDTMLLDTGAAGNTVTIRTAGFSNDDESITINLTLNAANGENLTLLADDGSGDGDGDVDINAAIGSTGLLGLLTINADELDFDANVDAAGIQATAQTNIEIDSTDSSGSVTLDVNGVVSAFNSPVIDADNNGTSSIIDSTAAGVNVLFRPLSPGTDFDVGDDTTGISDDAIAAVKGSINALEIGYDSAQFDAPANQSGKITINGNTTTAGTSGRGIVISTNLIVQAAGTGGAIEITDDIDGSMAGADIVINGANATTTIKNTQAMVTDGGGIIDINDSLQLEDGVTLTLDSDKDNDGSGGAVTVEGSIRGDGGGNENLIVDSGDGLVRLGSDTSDEIGDLTNTLRFGDVTIAASGPVTFNASVFGGVVDVNADQSGAISTLVTFNDALDLDDGAAGDVLDILAKSVVFSADTTLVTGSGGSVDIDGNAADMGTVTINNTANAQWDLDGSFAIDGNFTNVSLGESIRTTGDVIGIASKTTLTASVTLDATNTVAAGANIDLAEVTGTTAGTQNLTLNGGTGGDVTVSGQIGAVRLGLVTIETANNVDLTNNTGATHQVAGLLVGVDALALGTSTEAAIESFDALDAINSTENVRIITDSANTGPGTTAITLADGVTTSGDSVELAANEDIDIDGAIQSAGGAGTLLIRSQNGTANIGLGSDTAAAVGGANAGVFLDDASAGNIVGTGFAQVNIGLDEQGEITFDRNTGDFDFVAALNVDVDGGTSSGGTATINSEIKTITAPVAAAITFFGDADSDVNLNADLTTVGGKVEITDGELIVSGALRTIETGNGATATTGGAITLTNVITSATAASTDLTLLSDAATTGGQIDLGQFDNTANSFIDDLVVNANGGTTNADINVHENVQTANSINIQNGDTVAVDADKDITAGTSLTISNIGTEVDLAQNVDLTANDGNVDVNNNVALIDLSGAAGTNIITADNGAADGGAADGNVELAAVSDSGTPVELEINADDNVTLDTVTIAKLLDVNLDVDGGGGTLTTNALSAGTLTADGTGTADDTMNFNQSVASTTGGITINNANQVNLGDGDATDDVTAATSLTISNIGTEVDLAQNVDLTANDGNVDVNNNVALIDLSGAAGTNIITADNGAADGGAADGNVELAAVSDSGTPVELEINADDNVTLDTVTIAKLLDVNLDVDGGGGTLTTNALSAGTLTADGTGTADDTMNFNQSVASTTGGITINNANQVNLGDGDATDDVTAATSLTISNIGTEVDLAQNVDLTANDGNVDVNNNVALIDLSGAAGTNIITADNGAADGGAADGNVELAAVSDSGTPVELEINADDNVTLDTVTIAKLLDVNLDVDGGGGTLTTNALSAGTLTADGTGTADDTMNFNQSVASTTGGITINNANQVNFLENVTAQTSLTITNVNTEVDVAANVDLTARNGDILIEAANVTEILLSGGGGTNVIEANGGAVALTALRDAGSPITTNVRATTIVVLTSSDLADTLIVQAAKDGATVGSITATGTLKANTLDLGAASGITNNLLLSLSTQAANISADNTTTGNVDIDNALGAGTVDVNSLSTRGGNVIFEQTGGADASFDSVVTTSDRSPVDGEDDISLTNTGGSLTILGNSTIANGEGDVIYMTIGSGDVNLIGSTMALGNRVTIMAANRITDNADVGAEDPDVVATQFLATAGSGIGNQGTDPNDLADDNRIDTMVSNIEAQTGTGGIFITNTDNLNTGNLMLGGIGAGLTDSAPQTSGPVVANSGGGDIVFEAKSDLTVNGAVSNTGDDNITFIASGNVIFTNIADVYTGDGSPGIGDGAILTNAAGNILATGILAEFETDTGSATSMYFDPSQFVRVTTPIDSTTVNPTPLFDIDAFGATFIEVQILDGFANNVEILAFWNDGMLADRYPDQVLPGPPTPISDIHPTLLIPIQPFAVNGITVTSQEGINHPPFGGPIYRLPQVYGNNPGDDPAANIPFTVVLLLDHRGAGTSDDLLSSANGIQFSAGGQLVVVTKDGELTTNGVFGAVTIDTNLGIQTTAVERDEEPEPPAENPPSQETPEQIEDGIAVEVDTDTDLEEFFYKVWNTVKDQPGDKKIELKLEWLDEPDTLFLYFRSLDNDKFEVYYKPAGSTKAQLLYRLHVLDGKIVPWNLEVGGSDAEQLEALPEEFRSFLKMFEKDAEEATKDGEETPEPKADGSADQNEPQAEQVDEAVGEEPVDAQPEDGDDLDDSKEQDSSDGVSLLPPLGNELDEYRITRPLVASASAAVAGLAAARAKGSWKKRVTEAMEEESYSLSKAARLCRRIAKSR